MDWLAIASILGEREGSPLALLDGTGRVRMLNGAMERVLGFSRFQIEGQPWFLACTPPDQELEARRWIADALRGALRSYEAIALTKGGVRLRLTLELSSVGRGADQGLLLTVTRTEAAQLFQGVGLGRDLDYDVSILGTEFGSVVRLSANGECVPVVEGQDTRCHGLLYGLHQPCDDCPILQKGAAPWPRTLVRSRHCTVAENTTPVFEITVAEPIDTRLVRLRVRSITEGVLGAIQETKVQQLAERAHLSPREREVLGYLLLGRSTEDMAQLVGISPRTVKHHQANVLQKLGAESRADLVRLVL